MAQKSFWALASFLAAPLAFAAMPSAQAAPYQVTVYEAPVGAPFDATLGNVSLFTSRSDVAIATFNYSGPLNFSNTTPQNNTPAGDITAIFFGGNAANISNYSGSGSGVFGDFSTLAGFLASSGSISGYGYGSLYVFTLLGQIVSQTVTIRHDDGATLYANGTALPGTTAGPTSAVTETVSVPLSSSFQIAYARENGSPSILQVSEVAVPEPASTALLGVGLLTIGLLRSRSNRA